MRSVTELALIPSPAAATRGEGMLAISDRVAIVADEPARFAADALRARLWEGFAIGQCAPSEDGAVAITLTADPSHADEEYQLEVTATGIAIRAASERGFSHAVQTLLQLCPVPIYRRAGEGCLEVPVITVRDRPRLGWRGLMLDVARHFVPPREVHRLIDLMAGHKLNVLHLHLCDDQGWRLEIKAYPRLTAVGSWRRRTQIGAAPDDYRMEERPHGGFYSQDDVRDIVAYAARYGIVVVPEIDVPGHSTAVIAAYPALGVPTAHGVAGGDEVWPRWGVSDGILNMEHETVDFFRTVLDEVIEMFPSSDIHLGGDECPPDVWQADPRSRQLAAERGLPSVHHLQYWFLQQLSAHLRTRGRTPLVWDEAIGANLDEVTVLAWRGQAAVAAALDAGAKTVACPVEALYFDFRQTSSAAEPIPIGPVVSVATVLAYDPVPHDVPEALRGLVRGAQANLWTEHIDSPRAIDFMLWPRACALAEALWRGSSDDVAEFEGRLSAHRRRLEALGVEAHPHGVPLPWQRRPGVSGRDLAGDLIEE